MSTTDTQLVQRNASLSDLVALLREQHAAKLDVVIPAIAVRHPPGGGRSTAPVPPFSDPKG